MIRRKSMFFYNFSLKRLKLILFFAPLVIGIIELACAVRDFDASTKTPVDYSSVDVWQLKKGMFVEGDIPFNFGAFEEQYNTVNGIKTSTTGYIYLIPIDDMYIGFQTKTRDKEALFEAQADVTFDKINGLTTEQPETIHFIGKVFEMSKKDIQFAKEYMTDMGASESDINSVLSPYKLMEWDDFYDSASNARKELGIGIVCIISFILLLIPLVKSLLQERKNEQMKQVYFNNLEESRQTGYNDDDNGSDKAPIMRRDPFEEAREESIQVTKDPFEETRREDVNENRHDPFEEVQSERDNNEASDTKAGNTGSSTGLKLRL